MRRPPRPRSLRASRAGAARWRRSAWTSRCSTPKSPPTGIGRRRSDSRSRSPGRGRRRRGPCRGYRMRPALLTRHAVLDPGSANGARVRTAVAWTPRELSLVPLAADPNATVRGEDMDLDTDPNPADDAPKRAAINGEIRKLVAAAKLDRSVADALIDREASI